MTHGHPRVVNGSNIRHFHMRPAGEGGLQGFDLGAVVFFTVAHNEVGREV